MPHYVVWLDSCQIFFLPSQSKSIKPLSQEDVLDHRSTTSCRWDDILPKGLQYKNQRICYQLECPTVTPKADRRNQAKLAIAMHDVENKISYDYSSSLAVRK